MSLAEYEDFVYAACHVHEEDPAAHWRAVSAELTARAAELGGVRELRILGPDTDLRLGVEGRSWLAADGRYNLPDGEVFTSPLETETEGEIRYTFPAVYHGREVEDVACASRRARPAAEAARGDDYLQSLLDMDAGLASSARSRSGSTTRSTASPATSSSTRRSAGRCTSRSGQASRRAAVRTHPACTGT